MLELEFVLVPFVEEQFEALSAEDQAAYAELLEFEDWEIFDWLQERAVPPTPALAGIVSKIIAYNDRPR